MREDARRLLLGSVIVLVCAACGAGRPPAVGPTDAVPAARIPLPPTAGDPLLGFADYHAHMFSSESFGNFLFQGKAFVPEAEPKAIVEALAPCQHTRFPHLLTRKIVEATGDEPHAPDGYPLFQTWPRSDSHTHQQMYIDWLYRSYTYGLRLVTIVATNSKTLCDAAYHPGPCSDAETTRHQLEKANEMAEYVRDHEGGWLEIATSAQNAEDIIHRNHLAVVLGIEVDSLFDCGIGPGQRVCDVDDVRRELDDYQRTLHVVQINPVHLVDSAFGGSAVYDELASLSNSYLRDYYEALRDCTGAGVEWRLRGKSAVPAAANVLFFVHKCRIYDPQIPASLVGAAGHCNALGLTPLGESLIRAMMERGMVIDAEHMSDLSLSETLAIARQSNYPIILSHSWFRDLKLPTAALGQDPQMVQKHWKEQRSEMHRSAAALDAVRSLGGVVGVVTNQGYVESAPGSPVRNDCDTSSKSVAQALIYAAQRMGDQGVGFGTDFNGFNGQPAPRFGPFACGGNYADPGARRLQADAQGDELRYGAPMPVDGRVLTRSAVGQREFDFNTMGLAHYGMLPDLIADLQGVGVPAKTIDTLFHSAQAYVDMWKRAEARSRALAPTTP